MAHSRKIIGFLLSTTLCLIGCETTEPKSTLNLNQPLKKLNAKKEISPSVLHALQLVKEEKYTEASQFINQALQSNPKSPIFHTLNGLVYEKLSEMGDSAGKELSAIGYQNAISLNPSNIFAITQLAKLKYREQKFDQAQEGFANALLLKPNDPTLLHEFAAASYYAYDLKSAVSAIKQALRLNPQDPLINRSATMIYAALGQFDTAKKHLDIFKNALGDDPAVNDVVSRYNDWSYLYKSGRVYLTAAQSGSSSSGGSQKSSQPLSLPSKGSNTSGAAAGSGSSSPAVPAPGDNDDTLSPGDTGQMPSGQFSQQGSDETNPGEFARSDAAQEVLQSPIQSIDNGPTNAQQKPQIIVDAYLLRITEDAQTSKGNNILENLAVTFNPGGFTTFRGRMNGSGTIPPNRQLQGNTNVVYTADSGYRINPWDANNSGSIETPSNATFNLTNQGSVSGRIFTAGVTWAGLTYNLNIANAVNFRAQVVSRPSLMTFLNKSTQFFDGTELVVGLAGQYGGTLAKYPIGLTIIFTPKSIEGDEVTMDVTIEGMFLSNPNPNLLATIQTTKTRIDSFVKMRLGETLLLGGLYENLEIDQKNGFPGLQDIPIAQYFFSREQTFSTRRSVMIMVTPRSPDAVKSSVNRALLRDRYQPFKKELETRNADWFNTPPNLVNIFRALQVDPIVYYEFRSGDVLPPSWGWDIDLSTKLDQLQSFLYY